MTAAAPLPQPEVPATAKDLGHKIRSPIRIERPDGVVEWRAACACDGHWWTLLDSAEAAEAHRWMASW